MRPARPGVMFSGYWNRPQATVEATTNLWFHTGDFGRMNDGGFLQFAGRKKESVRRRGENVSMFELETVLTKHPAIADAAVTGVPSDSTEEDIAAYLVLEAGTSPAPDALFAFCTENLPYFAIPRFVHIVDAFPRNAMNRVMKRDLRDIPGTAWDFDAMGLSTAREDRR